MLIFGQDAGIARWMGAILGCEFTPPFVTIGIARDDRLVAGVIYNNFMWPNIEMTIASTSPRWATKETIASLLRYPFIQLNCKRCTALTEATNRSARTFLCRLGFVEEGQHPYMFRSGTGVSYGLYRQNAGQWLGELKHEQTIEPTTAG